MNKTSFIVENLILASSQSLDKITEIISRYKQLNYSHVEQLWDEMTSKEKEVHENFYIYRNHIQFKVIASRLTKKFKENKMGLAQESSVLAKEEIGIPVGTEYQDRRVVAVRVRENTHSGSNYWTVKSFCFYVDPAIELLSGDIVVVDCAGAPTTGIVINKEISAMSLASVDKWVIGKIDMTAHKARIRREQLLKQMEHKMENQVNKCEKWMKYRMLAEHSPEMAHLYNQMRALDPNMPALPDGTEVKAPVIEGSDATV